MSPQDAKAFKDAFFSQCPNLLPPIELMASMPNIGLFVKDRESRYVFNNDYHRIRYDRIKPEGLVGRRASEFFPPLLGAAYEANDRAVFESGETVRNQVWLVPTIRGTPEWFLSSKSPLLGMNGEIIGLLGLMSPIGTPEDQREHFGDLQKVIEYVDANFVDEITAEGLAKMAGLSIPQFNRRFRQLLRISPMEYVLSLKIQEAQRLLTTTRNSVGDIAAATGFYDQSHFTKRFRKVTGITPLTYRKQFR